MANLSNINNKFLVTTGGNVGINVTSPGAKLDVDGDVYVRNGHALYLDTLAGYSSAVVSLNASTNFIVPSGSVGIGTSGPSVKLDVVGSGKFQPGIADGDALVTIAQTNSNAYVHAGIKINAGNTNPFYIYQSGSSNTLRFNYNSLADAGGQLVITDSGNVGIGTTSPGSKLTVNKTKSGTGVENYDLIRLGLLGTGAVGDSSTIGWFSTSGTKTAGIEGISGLDNILYGELAFHVRRYTTDSYDRVMTINNRGNVGIGTPTPGAKLEVTTSTAGWSSIIQNTNGASDANGLLIKAGTVSSEYSLKVSNSTDSTNFMVVKGNGNVGIGTTAPGARIDIKGVAGSPATSGTTQNGILRIQNATNNNTLDIGQVAGSPYGTWLQAADKSDLNPIYTYPISLNPLGGNVGIGTTSPSSPLTVHGQQKWYTTNSDGNELRGFFNPGGAGDPAELSLYQANGTSVGVKLLATGTSYFVGGAVGIGDSTPNSGGLLDVVGGLISNGYNSNGRSTFDGSTNSDLTITVNQGQSNVQPRIWFQGSNGGGAFTVYAKMDVDGFYPPNGIFLGGTVTANKLDDYEEGTFTMTMINDGVGNTQLSRYTKVGRLVFIESYFSGRNITNPGNCRVSGLPFSADSSEGYGVLTYWHGTAINQNSSVAYVAGVVADIIAPGTTAYAQWATGTNKTMMLAGFYTTA